MWDRNFRAWSEDFDHLVDNFDYLHNMVAWRGGLEAEGIHSRTKAQDMDL